MKKWCLLVLISVLLVSGLLAGAKKVPVQQVETLEQGENTAVTKVAILPLKRLDSASDYIRKIMTVRDLKEIFAMHSNYQLQDMAITAKQFKQMGFKDVDALEIEDLAEIAKDIETELLIAGNISQRSQNSFTVSMRFYSTKTGEFKQISFDVGKERNARYQVLNSRFIPEMDSFIQNEIEKIYNIALNQYSTGNYKEAINGFTQVLSFNPDKIEARYYIGASYAKQKDNVKALEYLGMVLEENPENLDALLLSIEIHKAQNDVTRLIATMKKVAEIKKDAEIYLAIGNLYVEQKNITSAVESFQEALKIDPKFDLAQYRLAFLLYDEQQYSEALPYLEYAFDKNPDNDLIGRRIAIAYQKTGQLNEAVAKYELVITNNPQNVQAYLNVVGLYRLMASEATDTKVANANYQKAIDTMNNLKKITPDNPLIYLNLASIYLAQNKNKEAEANAILTINKDPNLYQSYVILATVTQAQGVDKYNQFADLEKKAAKAVGKQATSLGKERDAAKQAANNLFRKTDEYLKTARANTTDQEALNDINNRISRVANLINQTSGY